MKSAVAALLALGLFVPLACGGQVDADPRCTEGGTSQALTRRCFPKALATDADGRVSCRVFRTFDAGTQACDCAAPGHRAPESVPESVRSTPFLQGHCADDPCCSDLCFCEVEQLSGAGLAACQGQINPAPEPSGFCYVDPENGVGSSEITAECPKSEQRLLRFMGLGASLSLIVSCQGQVL